MGCGSSTSSNGLEVRAVTDEERQARLRDAWSIVEKDLAKLSSQWFLQVFQKEQKALDLFHFKIEQDLQNSKWLRLHSVMAWRVLGRAIRNGVNSDTTRKEIHSVADSHRSLPLTRRVWDVAKTAFIEVLEAGLGPSVWDQDLKKGFTEVFETVVAEMLKVKESSTSSLTVESMEQKRDKLVEESWLEVERDLDKLAMKLIQVVIEIAPDALLQLPMDSSSHNQPTEAGWGSPSTKAGYPVQSVETDVNLLGHGRLMLKTFGRAARNNQDLSLLEAELVEVGRTHKRMAIRVELFPKVGEALMQLLSAHLRFQWNDDLQRGWQAVIQFVINCLTKGHTA